MIPRLSRFTEKLFGLTNRRSNANVTWKTLLNRRAMSLFTCVAFAASACASAGPVNVLTNHNDQHNTGENRHEVILNPHNVRPGSFGKLFVTHLDGIDYSQPLFPSPRTPRTVHRWSDQ